jgi:hypothetical protein
MGIPGGALMQKIVVFTVAALTASLVGAEAPTPESPLEAVLQRAVAGYRRMEREIVDYRCILTKRERVDGQLRGPETAYLKVRHQQIDGGQVVEPFSVYLRFLRPATVKDREVLYVHGRNDGKMIVRNGGNRFAYITTALAPDSPAVLQEARYPITEIGVQTLTRRLIEVGGQELREETCEVQVIAGAKINNRSCTFIQVAQSVRREDPTWKFVRIFIDDELELPVYYAAYDWPSEEGGEPLLLEEYVYTHIELNVGLTDWDFDHRNENYLFMKGFSP